MAAAPTTSGALDPTPAPLKPADLPDWLREAILTRAQVSATSLPLSFSLVPSKASKLEEQFHLIQQRYLLKAWYQVYQASVFDRGLILRRYFRRMISFKKTFHRDSAYRQEADRSVDLVRQTASKMSSYRVSVSPSAARRPSTAPVSVVVGANSKAPPNRRASASLLSQKYPSLNEYQNELRVARRASSLAPAPAVPSINLPSAVVHTTKSVPRTSQNMSAVGSSKETAPIRVVVVQEDASVSSIGSSSPQQARLTLQDISSHSHSLPQRQPQLSYSPSERDIFKRNIYKSTNDRLNTAGHTPAHKYRPRQPISPESAPREPRRVSGGNQLASILSRLQVTDLSLPHEVTRRGIPPPQRSAPQEPLPSSSMQQLQIGEPSQLNTQLHSSHAQSVRQDSSYRALSLAPATTTAPSIPTPLSPAPVQPNEAPQPFQASHRPERKIPFAERVPSPDEDCAQISLPDTALHVSMRRALQTWRRVLTRAILSAESYQRATVYCQNASQRHYWLRWQASTRQSRSLENSGALAYSCLSSPCRQVRSLMHSLDIDIEEDVCVRYESEPSADPWSDEVFDSALLACRPFLRKWSRRMRRGFVEAEKMAVATEHHIHHSMDWVLRRMLLREDRGTNGTLLPLAVPGELETEPQNADPAAESIHASQWMRSASEEMLSSEPDCPWGYTTDCDGKPSSPGSQGADACIENGDSASKRSDSHEFGCSGGGELQGHDHWEDENCCRDNDSVSDISDDNATGDGHAFWQLAEGSTEEPVKETFSKPGLNGDTAWSGVLGRPMSAIEQQAARLASQAQAALTMRLQRHNRVAPPPPPTPCPPPTAACEEQRGEVTPPPSPPPPPLGDMGNAVPLAAISVTLGVSAAPTAWCHGETTANARGWSEGAPTGTLASPPPRHDTPPKTTGSECLSSTSSPEQPLPILCVDDHDPSVTFDSDLAAPAGSLHATNMLPGPSPPPPPPPHEKPPSGPCLAIPASHQLSSFLHHRSLHGFLDRVEELEASKVFAVSNKHPGDTRNPVRELLEAYHYVAPHLEYDSLAALPSPNFVSEEATQSCIDDDDMTPVYAEYDSIAPTMLVEAVDSEHSGQEDEMGDVYAEYDSRRPAPALAVALMHLSPVAGSAGSGLLDLQDYDARQGARRNSFLMPALCGDEDSDEGLGGYYSHIVSRQAGSPHSPTHAHTHTPGLGTLPKVTITVAVENPAVAHSYGPDPGTGPGLGLGHIYMDLFTSGDDELSFCVSSESSESILYADLYSFKQRCCDFIFHVYVLRAFLKEARGYLLFRRKQRRQGLYALQRMYIQFSIDHEVQCIAAAHRDTSAQRGVLRRLRGRRGLPPVPRLPAPRAKSSPLKLR